MPAPLPGSLHRELSTRNSMLTQQMKLLRMESRQTINALKSKIRRLESRSQMFGSMGGGHMRRQTSAFLQLGASDILPPPLFGGPKKSLMKAKPKIKPGVKMKVFHW